MLLSACCLAGVVLTGLPSSQANDDPQASHISEFDMRCNVGLTTYYPSECYAETVIDLPVGAVGCSESIGAFFARNQHQQIYGIGTIYDIDWLSTEPFTPTGLNVPHPAMHSHLIEPVTRIFISRKLPYATDLKWVRYYEVQLRADTLTLVTRLTHPGEEVSECRDSIIRFAHLNNTFAKNRSPSTIQTILGLIEQRCPSNS